MPKPSQQNQSPAALKKEVADLKAEIASLQKNIDSQKAGTKTKTAKKKNYWRKIAAWFCVALATALLVVGNIFFWTGNTLVNTDRYVSAVGPLIQKPEIQTAIASYTTTQLFNNVDVQGYVQSILPPRADVLAPQLTSQLKTYTQTSIQSLLANPKVQSYWYSSLARRHEAIISFTKNYEGNGTIEVSDIYNQLSKRLVDTKLSFLANKQLPNNVGSIKVATAGWLPVVHKLAKNIGLYQTLATLLLVGLVAAAIALSTKKRKMVIRLGVFFALAMMATLIAIKIAGSIVVSKVDPTYQSAVQVAYNTVFSAFVTQTIAILLLGALVVIIAWLSGPYKSATAIKARTVALLSGRLHQTLFGQHDNAFTIWVGKFKRQLQWGSIALIALIMVLVKLSPKLVVIYGLVMLVLVLAIEFLAAPNNKNRREPAA
ncbi:MAG TPA: hypothetical protein VLF90_04730 [Patescibacteria group bacterium]|nr:hypothetical protein [Patescibacteria group bacterium]